MSTVIPVSGFDPEAFWRAGALPLAVVLDLVLGDVPGRSLVVRTLGRLIDELRERVQRAIGRLGGGRGGHLFGGLLVIALVVGAVTGLVYLAVDRADAAGGPISLGVRTLLIVLGLSIRLPGDALFQSIEAADAETARRWLATATGRPIARLDPLQLDRVIVAWTGSLIAGAIVAPLFWLTLGGPAGFWGFIALRALGAAPDDRPRSEGFQSRGTRLMARLAEVPGALLGVILIATVAAPMRLHPLAAGQGAARIARRRPLDPAVWCQAALAGALGFQVGGEGVAGGADAEAGLLLGQPTRPTAAPVAPTGVRVFQLVALASAGAALLVQLLQI